ncbi:coiled-coil domain-containing protein 62 isoform X2 [Nothobranchius furzeri]|uniref:Transcript variant X2 n=1 Tax=Nothobranchius furzeri TaxID=105023 RepID=A0A9D3BSA3_NOTFU|nr:transcript variant X2 [Nothobranchius furzeri]
MFLLSLIRHSTSVEKLHDGTGRQWVKASSIQADSVCRSSQSTELPVKDLSSSTVQRQRRELQLLMVELKDREMELNAMAASHHQQHQAWEQDRQRALVLEQRCARLDEELRKRNEVMRAVTKHVCVVESREREVQMELSKAKQKLCELEEKQEHIIGKCRDYEEKNQSLSSTGMALSTQVGSLRVREEELSAVLKLKVNQSNYFSSSVRSCPSIVQFCLNHNQDKDVTEASGRTLELTGRLRDLDAALTQSRSQENKLFKDSEENKRRYKETKHEVNQLREELQQQVTQSSTQREEIIRLKQELQLLHADLVLTAGEGDSCWSCLAPNRNASCLRCAACSSQDELACSHLDHPSSRSLRGTNRRPDHDALAVTDLQTNNKPGVLSARVTDGSDHLSRCSLQHLLGESRLLHKAAAAPNASAYHSGPTRSPAAELLTRFTSTSV